MSDAPDKDQKTEAPTPKRLADSARDGDILQSKEFGTFLIMLSGGVWFSFFGPIFIEGCTNLLKDGLTFGVSDFRTFDPMSTTYRLLQKIVFPLASLFTITMLAAVAGPAMLGSLGFRTKAMGFKAKKLNPITGLSRMFGMQGLIELGKSLAKASILGLLGYWLIADDLQTFLGLGSADVKSALSGVGSTITKALLLLSLGLAVIAGIDVPIQFIRRKARLRMSKQEIKDEMKQSDGSPEMKQSRRQRQLDIAMGSARKAVSDATVILTNPTHFAVALRYRPGVDAAPVVVARGRGEVALAIRELANEKNVPMLEYPQLARAIYFTSRAGHSVAEDLYIAVATILAFVFNIERAMAEGVMQPSVLVPEAKQFDEHGKKTRH